MAFNIIEVDGVPPENGRFPVTVHPATHEISGQEHTGQLSDNQIPANIVRWDDHQNDPHTMIIDGRDVSADGTKLDSIEFGAEVNNLTDQQANSLTGGAHTSWHNHDDFYYRKEELYTQGLSQINWVNLINLPISFNPAPHTHDDRYYTENEIDDNIYTKIQLDGGQLDNRYYTESEINDNIYNKTQLDSGQLDNRYYTELEIQTNYYSRLEMQTSGSSQLHWDNIINKPTVFNPTIHTHDDRYFTEIEITTNYYSRLEMQTSGSAQLHWDNITNKPTIYTPSEHTHDDRYYTENESDARYSLLNHTHIKSNITDFIESDYVHTAGNETINGDKIFNGNITFSGLVTTVNSQTINLADNVITLNSDYMGSSPSENAGIEIERGTIINASIIWDESIDKWKAGLLGSEIEISLVGHTHDDRYYTESESDNKFAQIIHTHDDRYYTEIELNNGQLDNRYFTETEITTNYYTKSDVYTKIESDAIFAPIVHIHDDRYYTESEMQISGSAQLHWDNITNKPTAYTPSEHNHDDRYYTESETSNLLLLKSDITHTHDDRYFTELEITSNYYSKNQLNTGQLDSRYYTESEVDSLLSGKANLIHNHDDLYYQKSYIDQISSMYSLLSHTHDDRYYLKLEIDSFLNTKANVVHDHNSIYFTKTELGSSSGISGASRIGVSLIGGITATNVQSALQELKNQISSASVSLNQAYTVGSSITITNTQGPVKIDSSGSSRAPLELTNLSTAPTSNLTGGQIAVINGELYIYNIDKNKWLTPTKTLLFGRSGSVDGHSLYTVGNVCTFNSGYKMAKNGTIVSAAVEASNSPSKNIYILINGTAAYTITSTPTVDNSINLDFNTGDYIGMYVDSAGSSITNVVTTLEIAWRK